VEAEALVHVHLALLLQLTVFSHFARLIDGLDLSFLGAEVFERLVKLTL
jgi:hypothetical protein